MKLLAFNLFAMTVMFFGYFTGQNNSNPFWPKWVDACLFLVCAWGVLTEACDLKRTAQE